MPYLGSQDDVKYANNGTMHLFYTIIKIKEGRSVNVNGTLWNKIKCNSNDCLTF